MKVGRAEKVMEPANSDGEEEGGGGGKKYGGVAWRPMPRLVPLGLRGNPPQLMMSRTDDDVTAKLVMGSQML
ncbi:hypothetical protein NQZ68_022447 [Dissostichus eleginoides]|nr:hypothetical protein NQZ68_022447 [Dissostichus eleginoides]